MISISSKAVDVCELEVGDVFYYDGEFGFVSSQGRTFLHKHKYTEVCFVGLTVEDDMLMPSPDRHYLHNISTRKKVHKIIVKEK